MLKSDANELLSRVAAGTPMGELFRRFWLPAILSAEIEAADSPPKRLRILKEDLIAFRDTGGRVGIVSAYCAHRSAPLYFGRNEQCGIRCPYHGWKFGVDGACLEIPNVPAGTPAVRARVGIKAYPTQEAGGVVWIYMGPADLKPPLPALGYITAAQGYAYSARWLQRSNWLQGVEGEIDSSHISWLHKDFDESFSTQGSAGSQLSADAAPLIQLEETDYGFIYGARRDMGEQQYLWRVTHWLAPMFSLIARAPGPFRTCGGRAWVPIDDNTTNVFTFGFRVDRPFNSEELAEYESGALFPPRTSSGPFTMPDGYVIDTFLPLAARENDYLLDREMQRKLNYSGIWGIHDQDRALAENSRRVSEQDPGILDRSQEHLVASDRAVVAARRRLIKLATDLKGGIEPQMPANPDWFAAHAISKITSIDTLEELLSEHQSETYPRRRSSV
jgi:phthalate 4,5-dioxygenase